MFDWLFKEEELYDAEEDVEVLKVGDLVYDKDTDKVGVVITNWYSDNPCDFVDMYYINDPYWLIKSRDRLIKMNY